MSTIVKYSSILYLLFILFLLDIVSYAAVLNNDFNDFDAIFIEQNANPKVQDLQLLDSELSTNKDFVNALRKEGVIRVIIDTLADKERVYNVILPQLKDILLKHNISKDIEIIVIKVDINQAKKEALSEVLQENISNLTQQEILNKGDPLFIKIKKGFKNFFRSFVVSKYVPRLIYAIPSEMLYLGKTLYKSIHAPSLAEILKGSVLVPIALSQYFVAYIDKPVALLSSITVSLLIETFHNIWVSSWLDFQKRLKQEKGQRYQLVFNWTYGQFWGIVFRTISYSAGVAKDWVLSWSYIIPAISTAIVSSFTGSLAYNGLNKLYQLGVYSKSKRDFTQLYIRQALAIIIGTQFCLGANMAVFWGLFSFQQSQNLYYWVKSELSLQKPMILIVDKKTRETSDFAKLFPNAVQAQLNNTQLNFLQFMKNKIVYFREYIKNLFYTCAWVFNSF